MSVGIWIAALFAVIVVTLYVVAAFLDRRRAKQIERDLRKHH